MSLKNKDLAIVYRIYPGVSKVPPIHADDKFKLSELCLKSFKEALGDLNIKLWVLLDGCPEIYRTLFESYFSEDEMELIELDKIGNAGTFNKQIEILLDQNESEYIYFAEDDYFYLPNCFEKMLDLIKSRSDVDFVTPYDHNGYYNMELHNYGSIIIFTEDHHWQKVSTACMTFLTTKTVLNKTQSVFKTYLKNNYDASLWMSLTKYKVFDIFLATKYLFTDIPFFKIYVKLWMFCWWQILFGPKVHLWSPIPTLSTHMDSECLAPTKNWGYFFDKKQ